MEELAKVLISGFTKATILMIKIAFIIVPLTVLYEYLRNSKVGKMSSIRVLGLRAQGLIPLLTGLVVGLTYGAGVIIHSLRSSSTEKNEAFLILLFLSISHAMIEDTLIFVVVGANGLILILWRILLAVVCLFIARRLIREDKIENR